MTKKDVGSIPLHSESDSEIWRPRIVKGQTLGPGPVQSAVEEISPQHTKKNESPI